MCLEIPSVEKSHGPLAMITAVKLERNQKFSCIKNVILLNSELYPSISLDGERKLDFLFLEQDRVLTLKNGVRKLIAR